MSPLVNIGNIPFDINILSSLFPGCRHITEKARALDDSGKIIRLKKGLYIASEQESGKLILVKQDNGLIVTYGLLNEVLCDEDDRVIKGVLLGKAEAEVYLDFSWQGESLSYEEALAFQP